MPEKPIISKLFSFVTIRNPQLLTEKEKERGFIYFPSQLIEDSAYLVGLDPNATREERRTALSQTSSNFNSFESRRAVRNTREELHEFSLWLMKNKNILTKEKVEGQIELTGIEPVPEEETIIFWDNLFYQINTKKSDAVRESTIQLIVANNFLLKNDISSQTPELITNDEELRRLANAYVVIPDKLPNNFELLSPKIIKPKLRDFEALNSQLKAFEAKNKVTKYEALLEDVNSAVQINEIENEGKYNDALKIYNVKVEEAYERATRIEDPETGEISYENLELPTFDFKIEKLFERENIQNKVPASSYNVFKSIKFDSAKEDTDVVNILNKKISDLNKIIAEEKNTFPKKVRYKGMLIEAKEYDLPKYSFAANATSEVEDPKLFKPQLNIVTGYKNAGIIDSNLSLTFKDGSKVDNLVFRHHNNLDDTIVITLDEGIAVPEEGGPITIDGTITLDDDTEIEIEPTDVVIDGPIRNNTGFSTAIRTKDPKIKVFGINNIGVADFRKVEQEVCCYVPGEVSRIENILAKEYRERSTRELLSTENVTENTSEVEVENLTDTTKTERNELATEISKIQDEQESEDYGASASVSGKYGGVSFGANAFYNGASSSASSNANFVAQSQAEELIERALERVVQKTTKKRTSRILREFEENNKHGYDNRQGESHVTGVYRWVDKIYKNRLVNYGKRLMYEFNVPEPSRFFKKAIVQKIINNNGQGSSPEGIILPQLPQDPSTIADLANPDKISRNNYRRLASLYGAEVSEAPRAEIKVGKSSKVVWSSVSDDSKERKYCSVSDEIEIPEGYYSFSGKSNGQMMYHLGKKEYPNIVTIIGTSARRLNLLFLGDYVVINQGSVSHSNVGSFETSIPVSAMAYDNASEAIVSFEVTCKLKDEAYNQWKVETYNAIMSAYYEKVREYNDALYANFTPEGTEEERKIEFNPLLNRTLEKRELKRLAVQMLSKPFDVETAKNHYNSDTDIQLTNNLDKHMSYVKFFEQAFDWEIMAYVFYPYFYGDENDWTSLFLESNGTDPVFQAFLQSSMARMVVPVRPGFEEAVAYYLETGDVWMGKQLAVDVNDDLYISIAEELQSVEGTVEKEWETRVPTDLTIVQADSAPLNEKGLPCCHTENEEEKLGYGSSIMTGGDTTPTS